MINLWWHAAKVKLIEISTKIDYLNHFYLLADLTHLTKWFSNLNLYAKWIFSNQETVTIDTFEFL